MFKGVSSMQMYIFLLVSTASFKYASTTCAIIDKGDLKEETYIDEDCKERYITSRYGYYNRNNNNYLPPGECVETKQYYIGPTIFRCINSSFQEIFIANSKKVTEASHFYVSESSLSSLITDARTWSGLQKLILENTNVSKIIPGFFNGFAELTLLSIPHNNITVLSNGVFSSLINLVHLNLSYNLIYTIESLSFVGLSKLIFLDLHNNKIKSLPSKLFYGLSQLTYLDLSDNLLAIPAGTDISSLKKLLLGNNNLSVFTFPNNTDSSQIELLDISKNNISKIESFEMYKVLEINLSFNNITILNDVDGEITISNISHNGITFIGKHFISNSVSTLDLSFNSVYNISSNAFDKGTYLTHLYLNNNNLKDLLIGTFKNQEHLVHLDLSNNKILYFKLGLFNNLRSLQYLNISCNEGILDFQGLFRLNQLGTLDFEKNQPENLDEFFFETHKNLRQIRLGYNRWNCGDLAKFIYLMETRNITVLKGNNVDSTHIHGIECKSNLQNISKNNSGTTTKVYEGKENGSHNDFIVLNNSIIPYFEDLKNQVLDSFNKSFENTRSYNEVKLDHESLASEENNVQANNELYFNNLNLIFCNVFLFLIICILLVLIWYLKKRNIVQTKEQVELL